MRRVRDDAPLHVLVIIDSLTAGGAEMLLSEFAAGAPSAGLRLSVAYLGDRDGSPAAARLRERGVEPVALDLRGLLHPPSLMRVRRHVASVAPDIVHTHLDYADTAGGLAAWSLGVPVVSTVHVMEWTAGSGRDRLRNRLIAFARRRFAARVVAVSAASRRALLAAGLDRPERVVTIRNGVVAEPRSGAGQALRARLGVAPEDPVAIQVAVLRPGKGHAVAAEAVARARERIPGLRLLVAGDGPDRAAVERAVAPLGDGAVMLGHCDDVMAALDAADVLMHPSEVDAFPTVLLEAMAAGLPVVATAVGGIPEIVGDGETGLLVSAPAQPDELAQALERILDPAIRQRLGDAGRARYEQEFTAQRWAARTRELYERVLGR
jgi:glycosyltransferase involved in cell wall biosynthesis